MTLGYVFFVFVLSSQHHIRYTDTDTDIHVTIYVITVTTVQQTILMRNA